MFRFLIPWLLLTLTDLAWRRPPCPCHSQKRAAMAILNPKS